MASDRPTPSPAAPAAAGPGGHGPDAEHLEALTDAVRSYRTAEIAMRGRSRDSMHLGRSDMTALRLLLQAKRTGRPLSAAVLARELGISTAATTVLIDRLARSGHAERRASPTDRRGVEIWPTASTDEEVRSTMGALHERMMAVVTGLRPEEYAVIHRFLGSLGAAMAELDLPDFPTEGPDAGAPGQDGTTSGGLARETDY
ncbi:MarR family winged helix-turn-helix transcriptional regulator [Arthrobacter agilis]|uniref:MarR family winged helix-turn-helix transcriptional regulator n=1 Tax=Arthrobacter agilis TaxID=37921 RepID=UPI0027869CFB|nr:MarR family transcriptional regulator [Arthrobacter agilis]MDQ0735463.1 DNA-binding MarR family transcriptional regulator [Arthrobacter agilis]